MTERPPSADQTENPAGLPLAGLRVLDLATVLAAPFAASELADFGADVIKVEIPGRGDSLRTLGPVEGGRVPQQARDHARPASTRGKGVAAPPLRRERRADREFRAGHARGLGAGAGGFAGREPAAGYRARLRLRPDRAVPLASGLRPHRRRIRRSLAPHRPS